MTNRRKSALIILLVLILTGSVIIAVDIGADSVAFAQEANYYSPEKYTESDNLLNEDGTADFNQNIYDFAAAVKDGTYRDKGLDLSSVIPLQYLDSQEEKAVFSYNGKEYGFYVVKEGDYFDVLLIDFIFEFDSSNSETNDSDIENDAVEYKIKIKPILQQRFKRVEAWYGRVWEKYVGPYYYYVANPRFLSAIYNRHALNYGDEGYSKYSDEGVIISQYRVNYGKITYATETDLNNHKKEVTMETIFDYTCNLLDFPLGTIVSSVKRIIEAGDEISEMQKERTVLADNEVNINTYASKAVQRDSDKYLGYTRIAAVMPGKDEELILSDADDSFAEMITVLSNTDYQSKFIRMCDFDIARREGIYGDVEYVTGISNDKAFSFGREDVLFEKSLPQFEIDSSNFDGATIPVYLLPGDEQKVCFTPQYSGIYNFTLPYDTELSLNDAKGTNFSLKSGQTYIFSISGLINKRIIGNLQCQLERYLESKQYDAPAHSDYIICFFPTDNATKRVALSNSNLTVGLLDENLNIIISPGNDILCYNFIQSEKYYFIIHNSANEQLSTGVAIGELSNMDVGISYSAFHNRVMSISNDYPTSIVYNLTLTNDGNAYAIVTNRFGRVISMASEATDKGTIYTFNLKVDESYCVIFNGVLSNASATLTISQTKCVWKIQGDVVNESSKKLKPNATYSVEADLYVENIKLGTYKSFIAYSFGLDFVHSVGQIRIGNVPNNEKIVILLREASDSGLTITVDDMITKVKLMRCDGTQNYSIIDVELGSKINVAVPERKGYEFRGYYTAETGGGKQYVDANGQSIFWDLDVDNATLYAYWQIKSYTLSIHNLYQYNNRVVTLNVQYGEKLPALNMFIQSRYGYAFDGIYSGSSGTGTKFYYADFKNSPTEAATMGYQNYWREVACPYLNERWTNDCSLDLYANFVLLQADITYGDVDKNGWTPLGTHSLHVRHGDIITLTATAYDGYDFAYFSIRGEEISEASVKYEVRLERGDGSKSINLDNAVWAVYNKSCIAEGSLITLADGRQVAVETLTGNERLLVWNLYTGTYDTARILFIDKDNTQIYNVINLTFSDGTVTKIISEHGFWDYDLNRYVYLDSNASQYIGHYFNKGDTRVKLVSVDIRQEYTTAYSPVTESHLCYYVNGMLSMPGGIGGLFNIFEVNPDTMTYDVDAMNRDISQYGLFTYEEFAEIIPVSEEMFNAFNGQYLKIAVGKGLITPERLEQLAQRYSNYF